uniref:hypothetical protein n=1 Tax=Shewanella sp. TaxID=50422 RepID=UPI004047A23B
GNTTSIKFMAHQIFPRYLQAIAPSYKPADFHTPTTTIIVIDATNNKNSLVSIEPGSNGEKYMATLKIIANGNATNQKDLNNPTLPLRKWKIILVTHIQRISSARTASLAEVLLKTSVSSL